MPQHSCLMKIHYKHLTKPKIYGKREDHLEMQWNSSCVYSGVIRHGTSATLKDVNCLAKEILSSGPDQEYFCFMKSKVGWISEWCLRYAIQQHITVIHFSNTGIKTVR
ncbi:hypothetical protein JRQ81_019380, partial [Phrynocephalus forsythii]